MQNRLKLAVAGASVLAWQVTSWAQDTGSNAVTQILDNTTNARSVVVPVAIGGAVLFISVAAAKKYWKRIFG